jgi:undecaprenyl-diphosphatase
MKERWTWRDPWPRALAVLRALVALAMARPAAFQLLAVVFVGVLAPLVLLGKLAHRILGRGFFWDDALLLWIHGFDTPARDQFFLLITQAGRAIIAVPFCLIVTLWLARARRRGDALFFAVATFGAMFLSLVTKLFFGRDRPALWPSPAPETTLSFPSGHAMSSMAIAAALIALFWPTRWRWWAAGLGALFVLLVGLSRLYLGVHYPSDILGGWCASLAWVVAANSALGAHRRGYFQRGRAYWPILRSRWRQWRQNRSK